MATFRASSRWRGSDVQGALAQEIGEAAAAHVAGLSREPEMLTVRRSVQVVPRLAVTPWAAWREWRGAACTGRRTFASCSGRSAPSPLFPPVNLLLRLAWTWLARLWRRPVPPFGPCVTPFRVWPTDLDLYLHVNNGVCLSLLDVARVDLMYRARLTGPVRARGWYPVVAAETIRFRKSLQPFDRFRVVSRVIGWDDKALLMGQDFMRGDEVVASAVIRSRFRAKGGGSVAPADLAAVAGVSPHWPPLPDWVARWNDAQRPSGAAGVAQVS